MSDLQSNEESSMEISRPDMLDLRRYCGTLVVAACPIRLCACYPRLEKSQQTGVISNK